MHQHHERDEFIGQKDIQPDEGWDQNQGQSENQRMKVSDDPQLKMEMAVSPIYPDGNTNSVGSNEREPPLGEVLDQRESHDDRVSINYKGRGSKLEDLTDQSHHGPSAGNRPESPSKEKRDSRNTMPSSRGRDKTIDRSLETDGRKNSPGTASCSDTRSHGPSKPYDPHDKEYSVQNAYQDQDNHDGRRQDKLQRQVPFDSQKRHITESAQNPERATSKSNLVKHKQTSKQTSRTSEQRESDQKHQYVEWMRRDPSAAYDSFLQQVRDLADQRDEWEARVSLLTEEMLAGRDRFQPATDGDFKAKMNNLREAVKNLVREMNPREIPEKTFVSILEGKQLALAAVEKISAKSLRTPMLQSSIWQLLIHYFFATPFTVFGKEGGQAQLTWWMLFGDQSSKHESKPVIPSAQKKESDDEENERYLGVPVPEELCERWKSMTAIRMKDRLAERSVVAGSGAKRALQKMLDALSQCSNRSSEEPSWLEQLKTVLLSAVELAMVMAQQRSRLELFVPDLRKIYASKDHCCDGKTIDFEEGMEGPLSGKPVLIVTPGLRKWGDGFGGKLGTYIDLEAAYVKCIRES